MTTADRALWTGAELDAALGLPPGTAPDVTGVSIDSRSLEPGALFVALSGAPDPRYRGAAGSGRDGHDFVGAAAQAGAVAAIVSRETGAELAELVVPDPFDALWDLARAARDRMRGPVLAVTGSSGKTTAKTLAIAALDAAAPPCHGSEGSLNNHLGVPLSLARCPREAGSAVFEIGMNSPGEIAPLSRLVSPDVVCVLNVLPVHLEGLGSMEAIRREKLSITEGLGPDGTLVVHEPVGLDGFDPPRVLRFGEGEAADSRIEPASGELRLAGGTRLDAARLGDGPHRRLTGAAVLTMLVAAGLDPTAGIDALADVRPVAGRGNEETRAGVTVIDDSYNANPESIRLALRGLAERRASRRWALLGDMLELGEEEAELHAALAAHCEGLDGVFCVGERMRHLHEALPEGLRAAWWPDCEAMDEAEIAGTLDPGDVLLVKGSNLLFWKHGTVAALLGRLADRD